MTRVKALQSFAGIITMHRGEIREVELSKDMLDLIECGYVQATDVNNIDISKLTKKQLIEFARANDIEIDEDARKEVILAKIKDAAEKPEGGEEDETKSADN